MEHEFIFGTFWTGKQNYLFRNPVTPGNFPLEWNETSCFIYFPTRFSGTGTPSLLILNNQRLSPSVQTPQHQAYSLSAVACRSGWRN